MKKINKIVIAAMFVALCLFLAACGSVDGIYFDTEPRTTYVQGQELVLDGAVLVTQKGNKTEAVDISKVQISGYDKNQIGEQEVTFSYKDQTAILKVKVIPRITTEGVTTDYFVGASFDKANGRIKVADDEGKIKIINMSDDAVTIEGFDAKTQGMGKAVTVKYGDYSGTIAVNIYEASKVELTAKPKKTSYYSHETTFSATGAYFTVTAADGAFSRMVELTADMVKNFDPSAATVENVDIPLKQTVTISYLGHDYPFEISIRFSGVDLMRLRGEELADVDPNKATKEQGEAAILALQQYLKLTATQQAAVEENVVNKVLAVAVTWGAAAFDEAIDSFSATLEISSYFDEEAGRYMAVFSINEAPHDAVVADLARLNNSDEPFVSLAASLREIKDEFYDTKIGEKTVDEQLALVYDSYSIGVIKELFELMLELHDILTPVPADWTIETLLRYREEIVSAVVRASSNKFGAFLGYDPVYAFVSSWREKDDYFDIIYAYYLEYERDTLVDTLWQKVALPGELQQLYNYLSNGMIQAQELRVGADTTPFMYYYKQAQETAQRIKNSGNPLRIELYNYINFDALINNYLFVGTAESVNGVAYVYHTTTLIDSETYQQLLEKYLELLDSYLQNKFDYESAHTRLLVQEMIRLYAAFTPAERFAFLCTLHCDYRFSVSEKLIFEYDVDDDNNVVGYSYFTRFLFAVYRDMLSEEGFSVFCRLLTASELYALRDHNPQRFDGFTDKDGVVCPGFLATMEQVLADAEKLSQTEQDVLADLLTEFTEIYNACKTPVSPTLDQATQDYFVELKTAIEVFFELYNYAQSDAVESAHKGPYYMLAFAAYERAKTLATEIKAGVNADALYTYLYVLNTFDSYPEQTDGTTSVVRTFDGMLDEIGNLCYRTMLYTESTIGPRENLTEYNAFEIYYASGICEFLASAYDIMLAEYRRNAAALPLTDVLDSLNAYCELKQYPVIGLYFLSVNPLYFDGIIHCLEANLDEDTMIVAEILIMAQQKYAEYLANVKLTTENGSEQKQNFIHALDALKDSYESLQDKTVFDEYFLEMYQKYLGLYDDLLEQDANSSEAGSQT